MLSTIRKAGVDVADEIAYLIADVYELAGALRRIGETTAMAEGQTQARWQLLSAVSRTPCSVPQAARRLGITRQAVQRVANELVADGLAAFADNPDHRTSPLLTLTTAGHATLNAIDERARSANRTLGRRVGAAAVTETRGHIRALLDAIAVDGG